MEKTRENEKNWENKITFFLSGDKKMSLKRLPATKKCLTFNERQKNVAETAFGNCSYIKRRNI